MPYRIVKVPHQPVILENQARGLGWGVTVTPTPGPLFWGAGTGRDASRSWP